MIVAGIYSFNGGEQAVKSRFAKELREIRQAIATVDSASHKSKVSREKPCRARCFTNRDH